MPGKVIIMAFADYPRQIGKSGNAAKIRQICDKHGLKFVVKKQRCYADRLIIVADDSNMSGLGQAMLEVMGLGLSLTLAPWG